MPSLRTSPGHIVIRAAGGLLHTLVHAPGGLDGWVTRIAFSPNGRLVVSITGEDAIIKVWDVENGELLLNAANDPPTSSGYWGLSFNQDGRRILVGGFVGEIEMWELSADPWQSTDEEARQLYQIQSGVGQVSRVEFSPDGSRIVISGNTGLVEIRDAETGELLLGLQHPSAVFNAKFTPDGDYLMTSSQDGLFRIWVLGFDELIALANSRVNRALIDEECHQYRIDPCPSD
jgi:WD40 repeat protein